MCRDVITIFEDCGHDMEYTQYCANAPTETEKCEVEEPEKETHEPGLCGDCHQQAAVERQKRDEAQHEELLQRALRESAEEFTNRPQEAPLLPEEEDKEYQANLERIRQESLATHAAEKERKIATTADHVADDDEEALNRVLEESKRTAAKKIEKAPERRPGYVADDDEEELERIKELSMQQHEQELEERAKWHVPLYTDDEDIMQELNEFLAREKAEQAATFGGPSSLAPVRAEHLSVQSSPSLTSEPSQPDLWRLSSQQAPNPNSKKPIRAQSPGSLGGPAIADELIDSHNQQGNDFEARFPPLSAGIQPRELSRGRTTQREPRNVDGTFAVQAPRAVSVDEARVPVASTVFPEVSGVDEPDEDGLLKVQAQARAVWRDQQARKGKGANASSLRLGVSLSEESDAQENTSASRGRKAQVATETTAPSLAQIPERESSPAIDPQTAQSQLSEEERLRAHRMRNVDRRAGGHNRDNSTVDHDENDYRERDLAEYSDGHWSDYSDSHDGGQGASVPHGAEERNEQGHGGSGAAGEPTLQPKRKLRVVQCGDPLPVAIDESQHAGRHDHWPSSAVNEAADAVPGLPRVDRHVNLNRRLARAGPIANPYVARVEDEPESEAELSASDHRGRTAEPQTAADPYLPGFATAVHLPLPSYTQDAEAAAARGDARRLGLPPVSISRGGRGPAKNLGHARGRR
ncbi:hypothetical protein LTR16_002177 [Cryomyces antarcticus]|uniref:Uncharacterized protein n=1 Tax=Cryomyces antarcticus TaxID=329879 RepID=A0ABR0M828_9PEZI|nr:hypothetical protein LTR16_002177 [Cryomyces antarcticus]